MGFYLNGTTAYTLYKDETKKPYFVDKTRMLEELFPFNSEGSSYVCITRPRRFGKSLAANMIASYFGCGCDAGDIFDTLYIVQNAQYQRHRNKYNVIYISFNEIPRRCKTYEQYIERIESKKNPKVSREELRTWYDGYQMSDGKRIYNPRSVVGALSDNQLGSYWTNSGPYDEIFYYVEKNIADVRDDLALMVSGIPVPAKVQEYAAVSMNLTTKNEIFSAMLVYGFLTYENGKVSIPNKELMDKFADMLRKEKSLGYVYRLAEASERMLDATLRCDTGTMLDILELAHNTEVPLLCYNNETELTAVVNLVYLAARDFYRIEREDRAGKGYVDFIFYPEDTQADGIILELKVGHTPSEVIRQIKEKKYALRFAPKLGEKRKYTGRVLAVGITYDKETKKHSCEIEVL